MGRNVSGASASLFATTLIRQHMVDFGKRLKRPVLDKPTDPIALYDTLDRKSDKGPLRLVQRSVLESWNSGRRNDRDVVLKMHTGQGKTLVGLLVLQSRLNGGDRRALYLCPNIFLADQTLAQAKQFGLSAVGIGPDGQLPEAFLNGESILVATVQKLFNGRTKFGLGAASLQVDSVVLDDAHACVDAIKDAFTITIDSEHPLYRELLTRFGPDLEHQGAGTLADIINGSRGSLLPVPYWAWLEHHSDVATSLSRHAEAESLKFTWPVLRDRLKDCVCLFTGDRLSISPAHSPLDIFGTFDRAKHRVFMSASVTDDSFLVRGLGLDRRAIDEPLLDPSETWSGEKMILVPSLIDGSLDHDAIVSEFAPPQASRKFGVVVLVPSFAYAEEWSKAGAAIARKGDIDEKVALLRKGPRTHTLAIANRYDGIDLPDSSCRVLILDGKPQGEALIDRYHEASRPGGALHLSRTARVIEQGLGRAVRGEKDYCVVLVIAADLVKTLRLRETRDFFAPQTQAQVDLGLEVSNWAREELAEGGKPLAVLIRTMNQLLRRDENWKEFYSERMNEVSVSVRQPSGLVEVYVAEREAEELHRAGRTELAVAKLQALIDGNVVESDTEKGWYLQEMARYMHPAQRLQANQLQIAAHTKNRYLLRPRSGMMVSRLEPRSERRAEAVAGWIRTCGDHESLNIAVESILSDLRFGVAADRFEAALDALAAALGFSGERPDREWKAGPDNLWAVRPGEYVMFECKNEVATTRESINKHETGQLNNAHAWFAREYPGASVTCIMIIPTKKVNSAAGFNAPTKILRQRGLAKLANAVRAFFTEFSRSDLREVSESRVSQLLNVHSLQVDHIIGLAEAPTVAGA